MQYIDLQSFCVDGQHPFILAEHSTLLPPIYKNKKDYKSQLEDFKEEIDDLQNKMYAHNRHAILLIFQAMDAAGKDGTIRHVMSGINAHGVKVHAFKRPSNRELEHDFLWRTNRYLPQRGTIGIFNRSYYEEVLVVKVHPEILTKHQLIPREHTQNPEQVWQHRYQAINDLERHLYLNGTTVIKFFLNLSYQEQARRFISRIETPSKNWKFSESDVAERKFWPAYMEAFEACVNATGTQHAPWYVIPADDKRNMRLIVSQVILKHMKTLDTQYPPVSEERRTELQSYKEQLYKDLDE